MTQRLRSSVFGLLFVSSIALPVSAGAAGFVVGVHGGVTVPSGDFGDYWDTGFLFGGYAEYLMSEAFALGVDVNYATNNPSDFYTEEFPGSDDSEFQYLNIGAHGKWTYLASGSPLRPYGVFGGGMYSVKEKFQDETFAEEFDQTSFGLMGGLGLSWLATTSLRLELEANYHHVFTSEEDIGHSSAPFFGVQAGLAYAFGQTASQ